jgi:hypothetical protein
MEMVQSQKKGHEDHWGDPARRPQSCFERSSGIQGFSRAAALAKLLKYLCEKSFEGRVHEIKEFSIATEVYGRSESFGEKRDSVVRVEMSRLRKSATTPTRGCCSRSGL